MLDETTEGSATLTEGGAGKTSAKAKKAPAKRRTTTKKAPPDGADTPAKAKKAKPGAESTAVGTEPTVGAGPAKPKKGAAPKSADAEQAQSKKAEPTRKPKGKKAAAPKEAAAPERADRADEQAGKKAPAKGKEKAPAKKSAKGKEPAEAPAAPAVVFQAPGEKAPGEAEPAQKKPTKRQRTRKPAEGREGPETAGATAEAAAPEQAPADGEESEPTGSARRRRRRGGRRRRKSTTGDATAEDQAAGAASDEDAAGDAEATADEPAATSAQESGSTSSRRRRRRRRSGDSAADGGDDPENTVTKVRSRRSAEDQIQSVTGSTRLEAKKQRRREGREAGRRRAPIVSEAEFLARREAVERTMVVREASDLTQIAVLEDKVLVEHYVARESQTSLIGNVYLGRVQNVLPSMEAAFIDIGKGRNAVLYAGEVNWQALGHKDGEPRKIESVLKSGQGVLVQVTKDPIGHKGARLTSQISLAGRFLVYVPDGTTSGISRKLPDTERNRLKTLLKQIVPESAGVIVRTAAEGAAEEELTRDVERLKARWEDIEKKAKGAAPRLLYGEPDLTLKVVRDLFTEDFAKLVIEGDEVWETVRSYVEHVAPDLVDRLERFESDPDRPDVFAVHRIDEQIHKALDRKVWLPSGGSLIFDRTEAMTVVDVNTGKFTGSGGNLEETVTKNNLEAAEEIVRQLRLRDIGGIIVIDFIDMVLESNRDLVLRRLVECLSRDRTRHQVAEVTSLGLVQMTRKRIGTGLLEAFSRTCDACSGRGLLLTDEPVELRRSEEESRRSRRSRNGGSRPGNGAGSNGGGNASSRSGARTPAAEPKAPSPRDVAAMARPEHAADQVEPEPAAVVEADPVEVAAEPAPSERKAPASRRSRSKRPPRAESTEPPAEQAAATDDVPEPAPVDPTVPAADEAPAPTTRVVTRTRRRGASRPAGSPAAASAEGAVDVVVPTAETAATNGQANDEAEKSAATTVTLHVPVKKRGARKR